MMFFDRIRYHHLLASRNILIKSWRGLTQVFNNSFVDTRHVTRIDLTRDANK